MNGLSNGVDVNVPCKKKLFEAYEKVIATHRDNLQNYVELVTSIERSPNLKITNPIQGNGHKIGNYYLKAQERNAKAFEELSFSYNVLLKQEAKLQLEIDQIQKDSGEVKQKSSKYEEEHRCLKKDYKAHKYALNLVKDLYSAKFGMDIDIENEADDVFTAVVYFKPSDKSLPVKFTINREQNEIIDFDASSVLTKEEEIEMKMKLEQSGNIVVTSALRSKIVKKA